MNAEFKETPGERAARDRAYWSGVFARREGEGARSNPYREYQTGHEHWWKGWQAGHKNP